MAKKEQPIKILLIEDDEDDYLLLLNVLQNVKQVSYVIDWVKTYSAGVKKMKEKCHDVYLVDYRLGTHTGLDFIHEAQANGCTQPVILLTGLGNEDLGIRALRSGAEDYLIKGEVTSAILERSIRYALERKEAEKKKSDLVASQAARKTLESQKKKLESLVELIEESRKHIRERERYYASIIAALAEGVIVQDTKGAVVMANKGAQQILGLTLEEMQGKEASSDIKWRAIYGDGKTFPIEKYPSFEALKTKRPVIGVTMGIYRRDDTLVWILVSSTPMRHEGETEPYAVVSSFIDITTRKNLEQQKDQFIGTASHELKTPVTSLKLFAELLHGHASTRNDSTVTEYSNIIMAQSNRLVSLLNDLLDVTRIDAGRLELHMSSFDINELIYEIINEFKHTKKTRHEIIYEDEIKKPVIADRDRISQVLVNLLSNAIKYSPNADKVIIRAKESKGGVEVSVQDFGFGIPKDEQSKIFSRFFRTKDAHEKNIAGFGLGLHICQEIIRRHGGLIRLQSIFGKGSIFTFNVPQKR